MGLFNFFKTSKSVSSHSQISPIAEKVMFNAQLLETDLVILDAHASTCEECAKYQGRVFSLSGKSKLFPKVPDCFFRFGAIHKDCGHSFHPYIHEVNDPELEYTLTVHSLIDPRYGRDIVTFSNRPFIDDRS